MPLEKFDLWSDPHWCLTEGAITYAVVFEVNQLPSIYSLVSRKNDDAYTWSLLLLEHLAGPATTHRIGVPLFVLHPGVWVPPHDVFPALDAARERATDMIAERYALLASMLGMAHVGQHTLEFTLPDGLALVVHYGAKTVQLQTVNGALTITPSEADSEEHAANAN